jgi:hypothetical protein
MVLDIEGEKYVQGTPIIGFKNHEGQNQKFRIEPYNNA